MLAPMLDYDPVQGRFARARWCPSPNHDARPDGAAIDAVVIHNISLPPGQFGGQHVDALFCNCLDAGAHPYFAGIADLRVSAHLLIERDGSLVQFVPLTQRAWHAGQSALHGRTAWNDFSVGIELEGADTVPFDDRQYATLGAVLDTLLAQYPAIRPEMIVGHSDIAPGRKTDPGPAFDWARLRNQLEAVA